MPPSTTKQEGASRGKSARNPHENSKIQLVQQVTDSAKTPPKTAKLALEDGRIFRGFAFGASGTTTGEVCFNTSMTGYQEILTDPSYRGQIVTMTYPEIGNYGVNLVDEESSCPHLRGFAIAELSPVVSNWRAASSLDEYLAGRGIPGIRGIDTRALTKHLRTSGAMRGCLTTEPLSDEDALRLARESSGVEGVDFVREVSPSSSSEWDSENKASRQWSLLRQSATEVLPETEADDAGNQFLPLPPVTHHVVAVDFGAKHNILRLLRQEGLSVTTVPATTSAEEILSLNPAGVLLSNGPGDPATLDYAHRTVRDLVGKLPIFGICLGHQIIACALGGKTFKLKFGHRGANHPVQDLESKAIAITSQNHGFAVEPGSLPDDLVVTHLNLNDNTVSGLRHKTYPVFSVQYHPEASPGPHDASYFFRKFADAVKNHASQRETPNPDSSL